MMVVGSRLSVVSCLRLTTNHQLKLSNDCLSPTTDYQQPTTDYRQPTTDNHLRRRPHRPPLDPDLPLQNRVSHQAADRQSQ